MQQKKMELLANHVPYSQGLGTWNCYPSSTLIYQIP
uniref:Uncharacterized protein n=1 Tax=Arundo donax TaxID=35708 RepID=A0A0A9E080_ARUDO